MTVEKLGDRFDIPVIRTTFLARQSVGMLGIYCDIRGRSVGEIWGGSMEMIVELGRLVADKQRNCCGQWARFYMCWLCRDGGSESSSTICYKFLIKQMLRGRNQSVWMVPFLSHGIPGYGHGPGDDGNSAEGQGRTSRCSPSRALA